MWEDATTPGYGPLTIMHSAAGYYVGRMFRDPDDFTVPGSRESGYYKDRNDAVDMLHIMCDMEKAIEAVTI